MGEITIPYEDAESLLVPHVHEQRANKETKALTIPYLFIVQTIALQDASKHLLPFPVRVFEHINAWEAASDVFVDDGFVRAGFH